MEPEGPTNTVVDDVVGRRAGAHRHGAHDPDKDRVFAASIVGVPLRERPDSRGSDLKLAAVRHRQLVRRALVGDDVLAAIRPLSGGVAKVVVGRRKVIQVGSKVRLVAAGDREVGAPATSRVGGAAADGLLAGAALGADAKVGLAADREKLDGGAGGGVLGLDVFGGLIDPGICGARTIVEEVDVSAQVVEEGEVSLRITGETRTHNAWRFATKSKQGRHSVPDGTRVRQLTCP